MRTKCGCQKQRVYINAMHKKIYKHFIVLLLFLAFISTATSAVFIRTRGGINNFFDKLASTQVYTAELEVNGAPGTISIYNFYEHDSLDKLVKYLGLDPSLLSQDGFRAKLTEEQGGGMIFAFADGGVENNHAPTVIYFSSPENGAPVWLFPNIASPPQSDIQFSVRDSSRAMKICTYIDSRGVYGAIDNVRFQLSNDGWECITPGRSSTSVFFVKNDSITLVSAVPSPVVDGGCTVLIMEKE